MSKTFRLYAAVDPASPVPGGKTFYDIYTEASDENLSAYLREQFVAPYAVLRPSLSWLPADRPPQIPQLIVALSFPHGEAEIEAATAIARQGAEDGEPRAIRFFADPAFSVADHWCPVRPDQMQFGKRADARRLVGADVLGQPPFSGADVNVVIIDEGLNKAWIEARFGPGRFAGGWDFNPIPPDTRPPRHHGDTPVDEAQHGLMLVKNVLDIAPEARIYDLPLIPPRIDDMGGFLDEAHAAYSAQMLPDINQQGGKWILVNAWAIFDRSSEVPLGGYTQNTPALPLHPFTRGVSDAIDQGIDVLFCAGNCGQFCPDPRCGGLDRGPTRSIWGANSFHRVLTIGTVRTDGTWIGYSSQGPGQPNLTQEPDGIRRKPDICVPSGFAENFDAHTVNRGTSAATGMAAGVVAAIRSKWGPNQVSPGRLQTVLNLSARPSPSALEESRLGNGILDVPAALAQLP